MAFTRSAFALALSLAAFPALAETTAPAAPATEAPATAPGAPAQAPAEVQDIWLGEETAPLTIVEYASFTCSHCATFHKETFPKLKAEYIDTGKVRFAQRDVYFDQFGLAGGMLARCAGDDKYYAVGGMLMDQQKEWIGDGKPQTIADNLKKMGIKAGMTAEQVDACFADNAKAEALVTAFQKNATADGIEATPTFIIGGEKMRNAPWPELKAKIDEKLAEAGKN